LSRLSPFLWVSIVLTLFWLLLEWTLGKADSHLLINQWTSLSLDPFFLQITRIGEGWVFGIGLIYFLFRSFRDTAAIALCGLIVLFGTAFLKHYAFTDVLRPFAFFGENQLRLVDGLQMHRFHSFPSGHALASFASLSIISLCGNQRIIGWMLAILALVAAFSRVYLSQHFMEDIVAGAWIGCFFSYLTWMWSRRWSAPTWDKGLGSAKK
jgi:membrane-associated phospholipid phosphatase